LSSSGRCIMTKLIDEAVQLVIADGDCAVPESNAFGGVDVWKEGQQGLWRDSRRGSYFAEGVRIATDDNEITVTKFVGRGLLAKKITISGDISVELLAQITRGLL